MELLQRNDWQIEHKLLEYMTCVFLNDGICYTLKMVLCLTITYYTKKALKQYASKNGKVQQRINTNSTLSSLSAD